MSGLEKEFANATSPEPVKPRVKKKKVKKKVVKNKKGKEKNEIQNQDEDVANLRAFDSDQENQRLEALNMTDSNEGDRGQAVADFEKEAKKRR